MTSDQIIIIVILMTTMALFLWGSLRHDIVALGALLICVLFGLVPNNEAFTGFGHPAVITVASVLVLGYGLQLSGAVDILAKRFLPTSAGATTSIFALIGLAALLSSFMNNVGALALLMPIAIQMAGKFDLPAGKVLMPLAFGSILGGMTTLIGTPPNLIVSGYRDMTGMGSFGMFDFTPVGFAVALIGIIFVGLIGRKLVPERKQAETGSFDSGAYLSEVRISESSKAANITLREVEKLLDESGAQIVSLVRRDVHISAPNLRRVLRDGDILGIEVEPESLQSALTSLGVKLEEAVPSDEIEQPLDNNTDSPSSDTPIQVDTLNSDLSKKESSSNEDQETDKTKSDEVVIQELVVMPNAVLVNRSATDIELRTRFGINLLAISRKGHRTIKRLRSTRIYAGDVLLVQGSPESISGFAAQFGCLPLAARDIRGSNKRTSTHCFSNHGCRNGWCCFWFASCRSIFCCRSTCFCSIRNRPNPCYLHGY